MFNCEKCNKRRKLISMYRDTFVNNNFAGCDIKDVCEECSKKIKGYMYMDKKEIEIQKEIPIKEISF